VDDTPDATAAIGADPLDTLRTAWNDDAAAGDGVRGIQMVADWVAKAFGWAAEPPGKGSVLSATKPVGLLGKDVDDFGEYYMSCPCLTAR
jgi:hypothetical protein